MAKSAALRLVADLMLIREQLTQPFFLRHLKCFPRVLKSQRNHQLTKKTELKIEALIFVLSVPEICCAPFVYGELFAVADFH